MFKDFSQLCENTPNCLNQKTDLTPYCFECESQNSPVELCEQDFQDDARLQSKIDAWFKEANTSSAKRAPEFLKAAASHMEDRAATYDRPEGERSMAATVAAFNAITGDGFMNTEERGWLFMILLKAVRTQQGGYREDNYEDGAAYFALSGEAASANRVNPSSDTF